jgi:hypothetical protein
VEPIGRLCAIFRDAPSELVDGAERKLGVDISLSGRLMKPFCGLLIVVRYAFAQTVHCSELKLRLGMPLPGRLAIPFGGLLLILRNTFAVAVHPAEFVLGLGITLFRQGFPLLESLCKVSHLVCASSLVKTAMRRLLQADGERSGRDRSYCST